MSTPADRRKWHRELKKQWQGNTITTCEVRFKGCFGTYGLAPAHSRKRREIETREQYAEVCAACTWCHRILDEQMSHKDMETKVKQVIEDRDEWIQNEIDRERVEDDAMFFEALYD